MRAPPRGVKWLIGTDVIKPVKYFTVRVAHAKNDDSFHIIFLKLQFMSILMVSKLFISNLSAFIQFNGRRFAKSSFAIPRRGSCSFKSWNNILLSPLKSSSRPAACIWFLGPSYQAETKNTHGSAASVEGNPFCKASLKLFKQTRQPYLTTLMETKECYLNFWSYNFLFVELQSWILQIVVHWIEWKQINCYWKVY